MTAHPPARPEPPRPDRALLAILALALVLRLVYGLAQDHAAVFTAGNDAAWYLMNSHWLLTGQLVGPLSTAPLFHLFAGFWEVLLGPDANAVAAIRVSQAVLGALTCYFAYRLAWAVSEDRRAARLAALLLAVGPVFVMEAAQVLTETLYLFCVMLALWLTVDFAARPDAPRAPWSALALAGVAFGLAALTRAVLLLFPLGIVAHLVLLRGWRRGLAHGAILLAAYALTLAPWTVYNLVRWDAFVVAGEGFGSFLYLGARDWAGPEGTDAQLAEDVPELTPDDMAAPYRSDDFLTGARRAISQDPLGYLRRRVSELGGAYLQPHGTTFFDGPSLKDMARMWLVDDRSLDGLRALLGGQGFWPKLALYLFHYTALIAGAAGMWLTRRRWRVTLPLLGWPLYTTLVHFFLLALPRYIFPTTAIWWVFAAVALTALWDRRLPARLRSRPASRPAQPPSGALPT